MDDDDGEEGCGASEGRSTGGGAGAEALTEMAGIADMTTGCEEDEVAEVAAAARAAGLVSIWTTPTAADSSAPGIEVAASG